MLLTGRDITESELRRRCRDWIYYNYEQIVFEDLTFWENLKESVGGEINLHSYMRLLMKPTYWGGRPELIALASVHNVRVQPFARHLRGRRMLGWKAIGEPLGVEGPMLRLVWKGGKHYKSLVLETPGPAPTITVLANIPEAKVFLKK